MSAAKKEQSEAFWRATRERQWAYALRIRQWARRRGRTMIPFPHRTLFNSLPYIPNVLTVLPMRRRPSPAEDGL